MVAALLALAAAGLVLWSRRDPYSLSWFLPPVPVTLGLLTLALLPGELGSSLRFGPRWSALGYGSIGLALVLWSLGGGLGALALGLVGGILLLDPEAPLTVHEPGRGVYALLLVAIILVAGALRFHRLTELPVGMWRDEARHGLVAVRILEDPEFRPVYVAQRTPTKINLPGFGFYLLSAGVRLFGIEPWSMRPATAAGGMLTLLPFCAWARHLGGGRSVALLATGFLATTLWHVVLSRYQFATIFDPLFTLTGLWLVAVGATAQRAGSRLGLLFLAGVCFALAVQTYHSARVVPLVGAAAAILLFPRGPGRARAAASLGLGFLIALLPLLVWGAVHPAALNDRVREVALLPAAADKGEPPLAALDRSLLVHLGMFNAVGDGDGRHNLPGRPVFDGLVGFGFLAGLPLLLARPRHAPYACILVAWSLGLLPSAFAIDGPHALRAVGALAPACLIAALGWVRTASWLFGPSSRRAPLGLGMAVAAAAALLSARVYFEVMPDDPRVFRTLSLVSTAMGRSAREIEGAEPGVSVFVPADILAEDAFQYLTHGLSVQTFRGGTLSAPPVAKDVFLLRGPSPGAGFEALKDRVVPDAPRPGPALPANGEPAFVGYRAR